MKNNTRVFLFTAVVGSSLVAIVLLVAWMYLGDGLMGRSFVGDSQDDVPANEPTPKPSLATVQELAVATRALGPTGIIALGIERFRHGMGRYPAEIDELLHLPATLAEGERWDGPYINNPRLLTDPWGGKYRCQTPGVHNPTTYDLWTCGADGVCGTADDMGNW